MGDDRDYKSGDYREFITKLESLGLKVVKEDYPYFTLESGEMLKFVWKNR